VFNVTLAAATMVPTNDVAVPNVAELPTRQKTLHGTPPVMTTDEPLAVVNVLPMLKIHTELEPRSARVNCPVNWAEEEKV
jgi:hypothetical protein